FGTAAVNAPRRVPRPPTRMAHWRMVASRMVPGRPETCTCRSARDSAQPGAEPGGKLAVGLGVAVVVPPFLVAHDAQQPGGNAGPKLVAADHLARRQQRAGTEKSVLLDH